MLAQTQDLNERIISKIHILINQNDAKLRYEVAGELINSIRVELALKAADERRRVTERLLGMLLGLVG